MINYILGSIIIGFTAFIILRAAKQLKEGKSSCGGCEGCGGSCGCGGGHDICGCGEKHQDEIKLKA